MQRSTKIILGALGGVVLLGILAIGGAAWYVSRNAEGWLEQGKAREDAGREAGAALDSRGCVEQAVAGYRKERGPISAISHRLWLKGCLETAEPDVSICPVIRSEGTFDQVREVLAAQTAFCREHDLGADQNCQHLADEVFEFCFPTTQQP
jgi:hypothetical protein